MNANTRQTLLFGLLTSFCFMLNINCDATKNKEYIGSAVVEAQTFQIATTAQGTIVALFKAEGQHVGPGELVAIIDTVPLVLKLNELSAALAELGSAISSKKVEISSQESDVKGVDREYKRISNLVEQGSVPSQQKDNLETQFESSKLRVQANRSTLSGLQAKINTINAQRATLLDQLSRCYVHSPSSGTILTKYKNLGEVVPVGNPIFELGKYDTMQIDFYVTQPMLPSFTLGQKIRVRLDNEMAGQKETQTFLPATVTWISEDAEFSPKNIQTRESRNELVFKIRAQAPNQNSMLKRGLPVEIWR